MKMMVRTYHVIVVDVAIVLLTGCGGLQPPIGAPGTMPQSRAITTHADRGGSWMLPEAKHKTLVYVTTGCSGTTECYYGNTLVYAFAYPSGNLEGTLTLSNDVVNACSDDDGNVWFTEVVGYQGQIVKYKHGGTKPIETLNDKQVPTGCAVDPTTGTLAVMNDYGSVDYGGMTIYPAGLTTSKPIYYAFCPTESTCAYPDSCTYDSSGDLFVTLMTKVRKFYPTYIIWLPKGAKRFEDFVLDPDVTANQAQWYGKYLAVAVRGSDKVDRFKIEGAGYAKSVGHAGFLGLPKAYPYEGWWIADGRLFAIQTHKSFIDVWHYPEGGEPIKTITGSGDGFTGVTVSYK